MTTLNSNHAPPINLDEMDGVEASPTEVLGTKPPSVPEPVPARKRIQDFATRANFTGKDATEKKKVFLLGGSLIAAVAFFLFTQFETKPAVKHPPTEQKNSQQQATKDEPKQLGSVTPMMDPVQQKTDQANDRITASEIQKNRKPGSTTTQQEGVQGQPLITKPGTQAVGKPLGAVPPFKDTQQKWEDPAPYNATKPADTIAEQEDQRESKGLAQASLIYVRSPQQPLGSSPDARQGLTIPTLKLREGTRIQAHLETQISSAIHAPVVAVVDNTYAIGDHILVPAGARIYGKLSQADPSGNVGVEFNQIELVNGPREEISAMGTALDLGPIKGDVYGKHNGKNFLVRAATGIASTASVLIGGNVNGAYSQGDMIRQRGAENIGTAGDSEISQLNANTHIFVTVPANTRIYVVWMEHSKDLEDGNHNSASARPSLQ